MKVTSKYCIAVIAMLLLLLILCSCKYDEPSDHESKETVSAEMTFSAEIEQGNEESHAGIEMTEENEESPKEIPERETLEGKNDIYSFENEWLYFHDRTLEISRYFYDVSLEDEGKAGVLVKNEIEEKIESYFPMFMEADISRTSRSEPPISDMVIEIRCFPVYSSDNYLVVRCEAFCDWGIYPQEIQEWYITVDRNDEEIMKLEDYYGENITEGMLYEIPLPEYERLVQREPEKYTMELYEKYYDYIFANSTDGVYGQNRLEEYYHYYFTEEGMVLVYGPIDEYGEAPQFSGWDLLCTGRYYPPFNNEEGKAEYMEIVIPYADLP